MISSQHQRQPGLLISKEGRGILNFYKNVDEIYSQLLKQCDKDYRGEIALFALSPEYRGLGIGKMLFHSVLAYMKSQSISDFYLYTDTSCNFGFYEHQGMKRCCEKKHIFQVAGQNAEMRFFIYESESFACR